MLTVEQFIKLFIQSEHTTLIEFRTDNLSWPQSLRFSFVSIDNLLKAIYVNQNTDSILRQKVTKINQVIGGLGYIKTSNNIETFHGHITDRIHGIKVTGTTAEGEEVEIQASVVLEVYLDNYDYDQE